MPLALLVLDVRSGDAAQRLYETLDWQRVGEIPEFVRSSSGRLDATTVYFRRLAPAAGEF